MGEVTSNQAGTDSRNTVERLLAQIRGALPDPSITRRAGSVPAPRKTDANAATTKTNEPQRARTEAPKADTKKNVKSERQSGSKKPDKKPPPPKKSKRGPPSGPGSSSSSSSSSSSDSSSSDSEDSLDEDLSTGVVASDATKVGGTLLTLRPYVSSSTLEKFDEKASMGDRRSWWERFVNMSVQGGWTDKMKISELKMKMSSAVRNWRGQLSKHVQSNWRRLSGEFKRKYLKARASESERYYTMRQKSNESAMEFFYRLNEAAVKAGIRYKKGKKDSAHHIKRFIKRDQQLKAILRNTRFHNLDDLEYVLQQDEDLGLDGGYDTPPHRTRDFRADNIPPRRFKPGRQGRAYIGLSGGESEGEVEGRVRFEDEEEDSDEAPPEPRSSGRSKPEVANLEVPTQSVPTQEVTTEQEIRKAVFRVMEHSGWRPPPQADSRPGWQSPRPGWKSPRPDNPNKNEFCEKCSKFGHKEENCWSDMKCGKCKRTGHPTHACRIPPCKNCGDFHDSQCADHEALQAVKTLARQGMLKDLPAHILKKLLGG
ncbi:hypothetical protein PF003_g38299 [Phytophthora fragariae]|nr:hypothetical protein PF003_g38299 [Phytophthora fragariae]